MWGDTSTNKGIIDTAILEPDNFVFYNNGISAVSGKIEEHENGEISCHKFSIINGAQTVRSIAKAHTQKPLDSNPVVVLVRVSEFLMTGNDPEGSFLDKITRFNNTQNAVKISDFRSNDPVQYSLVRGFEKLTRKGKKFSIKISVVPIN